MSKFLFLLAGGIVGTLARYLLAVWTYERLGAAFPYGILFANVLGCFLVGLFATLAEQKVIASTGIQVMLIAGFCGAFTTFSALMLDTVNLIRNGQAVLALVNVFASGLLGFASLFLGIQLGNRF